MKLVFPQQAQEQQAKEFIEEFRAAFSHSNGDGGLSEFLQERTYAAWLAKIQKDIDVANLPADKVPALTYFFVDGERTIVGIVNIRLALNDFLRREGGHIGYSIRPAKRRMGYGKELLRQALLCCRKSI